MSRPLSSWHIAVWQKSFSSYILPAANPWLPSLRDQDWQSPSKSTNLAFKWRVHCSSYKDFTQLRKVPSSPHASLLLLSVICSTFRVEEKMFTFVVCPWYSLVPPFVSSVRSSNSHPDPLVIQQQHPHFFRSHRSLTLDFHFHYSYIKAIKLYKGNHWTHLLATCIHVYLMGTTGHHCKIVQDSAR